VKPQFCITHYPGRMLVRTARTLSLRLCD
jgi:hypothetical protein